MLADPISRKRGLCRRKCDFEKFALAANRFQRSFPDDLELTLYRRRNPLNQPIGLRRLSAIAQCFSYTTAEDHPFDPVGPGQRERQDEVVVDSLMRCRRIKMINASA